MVDPHARHGDRPSRERVVPENLDRLGMEIGAARGQRFLRHSKAEGNRCIPPVHGIGGSQHRTALLVLIRIDQERRLLPGQRVEGVDGQQFSIVAMSIRGLGQELAAGAERNVRALIREMLIDVDAHRIANRKLEDRGVEIFGCELADLPDRGRRQIKKRPNAEDVRIRPDAAMLREHLEPEQVRERREAALRGPAGISKHIGFAHDAVGVHQADPIRHGYVFIAIEFDLVPLTDEGEQAEFLEYRQRCSMPQCLDDIGSISFRGIAHAAEVPVIIALAPDDTRVVTNESRPADVWRSARTLGQHASVTSMS